MKIKKFLILALLIILIKPGCSITKDSMEDITIYTTIYPIKYLLDSLYGDNATINSIYPSGVDTNDYELSDKKLEEYSKTDLFVFNSLDKDRDYAVKMINKNKNLKVIDVSLGITYVDDITELWLNPYNYLMMAQNTKDGLLEYIDNPYLNATSSSNKLGLVTLNPINDYNKKLKWRSDHNFYVGIRFTLFDHLSANVRYYNTLSKDVVTRIKDNVVNGSAWKWNNGGEIRNSGLEFGLNADILKDVNGLSLGLLWNGTFNKNKLETCPNDFMTEWNESNQTSTLQLKEGKAVNAIYAVDSKGIDAQTGKEIFITQNGTETNQWEATNLVYQGDPTPKLAGSFGLLGSLKNWSFNCMFRYSFGSKLYNITAVRYVDEAFIGQNGPVDMMDKWQKAGDQTEYLGFDNSTTLPTSRFVESRNVISLASLRVDYQFDKNLANKLYMQDLHLGLSCNDLFHYSSVKMPRGLIYPFARSFTLSLQATF